MRTCTARIISRLCSPCTEHISRQPQETLTTMHPPLLPVVEPWMKDCIACHFNDQPLNRHGQPDWFSERHMAWIENLFRWKRGDFVLMVHRFGPELAKSCSSSVFNSIRNVKAEVGPQPRVEINGRDVPAWFTPGHNRWLELTLGWAKGQAVKAYQGDRYLVSLLPSCH